MNFAKNLILAICLTFNPGVPGFDLFIKPSLYLMPKEIFTNRANWDMAKKYVGIKAFPQCINLYDDYKTSSLCRNFQIHFPLPDIVAMLTGGRKDWAIGRLDDLTIGRLDDWAIGRLDDWTVGRLEDLTVGRFEYWMIKPKKGKKLVRELAFTDILKSK
jgi:hypothetical protein